MDWKGPSASPKMPDPKAKSYKNVSLSMYLSDLAEADRLSRILRRSGWPAANRSLIFREALRHLEEHLADKSEEEVFDFFVSRGRKRGSHEILPEPKE